MLPFRFSFFVFAYEFRGSLERQIEPPKRNTTTTKKKKPQAGKKKDNKQKREVTKNGFSSKGLKGSNWGIKKIVNE